MALAVGEYAHPTRLPFLARTRFLADRILLRFSVPESSFAGHANIIRWLKRRCNNVGCPRYEAWNRRCAPKNPDPFELARKEKQ